MRSFGWTIKSLGLDIKMETAAKQGVGGRAEVIFKCFFPDLSSWVSSSDSHLCSIHQVLGCRRLYKPFCKPFCKYAWLKHRPCCVSHIFERVWRLLTTVEVLESSMFAFTGRLQHARPNVNGNPELFWEVLVSRAGGSPTIKSSLTPHLKQVPLLRACRQKA